MTCSPGYKRIKSISWLPSTIFWCAAPKNALAAIFTWVVARGKTSCSYLQLWLPYPILAPFPYLLYTQGEDVKYIRPAPVFHQTPPLAHALFWCHLLRDIEDNNKSFYLLSACCELSIYISNFKFSRDLARTVLSPFL